MKRTAISIAVGALSIGLSQGLLAQDEEAEVNERQQMTQEGAEGQGRGAEVHVEGESADISVEQEPAEIRVEQQPPNVTVEQQAPQVTIEQPDPNVSVEQADPNVTVEETGEASVEVERAHDVDAQMRDPDQRDEAQQEQSRQGDNQASRDRDSEADELMNMTVGDIEGYTIYSREDGKEIGDVDRVVRDTQNDDIYVVVTKGGFLGFGKDEFGYKLENVALRGGGDEELVVHSGDEGISGDYGSDRYESLDGNATFRDSLQGHQGQGN